MANSAPQHQLNAGSVLPRGTHTSRRPQPNKSVAELVDHVKPNTVIGRPQTKKEKEFYSKFLPPSEKPSPKKQQAIMQEETLIVGGYEALYQLAKENLELQQEPEIASLVTTVDSISKRCGCVKMQIQQAAADIYSRSLPVIQARNPSFFDVLKNSKKVSKIIFKEKDLVLLEV